MYHGGDYTRSPFSDFIRLSRRNRKFDYMLYLNDGGLVKLEYLYIEL